MTFQVILGHISWQDIPCHQISNILRDDISWCDIFWHDIQQWHFMKWYIFLPRFHFWHHMEFETRNCKWLQTWLATSSNIYYRSTKKSRIPWFYFCHNIQFKTCVTVTFPVWSRDTHQFNISTHLIKKSSAMVLFFTFRKITYNFEITWTDIPNISVQWLYPLIEKI